MPASINQWRDLYPVHIRQIISIFWQAMATDISGPAPFGPNIP
jgi:hypothetical protein